MTARVEYGVRLPDGSVEPLSYDADTATVMSYAEYAQRRAAVLGGTVITRTSRVEYSDWEPEPTPAETAEAKLREHIRHVRELARDIEYTAAQQLADLVEEYLEARS